MDYVLWKKLNPSDFNAMNGLASPGGRGGGARHVPLGVETNRFPISKFLASPKLRIRIPADSGGLGVADLEFASIPGRRRGEWMIADQRSHRHLAWTTEAGFPVRYDQNNRPTILVFRLDGHFHARLTKSKFLEKFSDNTSDFSAEKGIAPANIALLSAFSIAPTTSIEAFDKFSLGQKSIGFDPSDLDDGRKKIFASVVMRQGQPKFRKALLIAYNERCAMTKSRTKWVLEAAHIVPYRGVKTNAVQNGILLRSDLHTLFDLGLVSIDPFERKIQISSKLRNTMYRSLEGRPVLQPNSANLQPSNEALAHHFGRFQK